MASVHTLTAAFRALHRVIRPCRMVSVQNGSAPPVTGQTLPFRGHLCARVTVRRLHSSGARALATGKRPVSSTSAPDMDGGAAKAPTTLEETLELITKRVDEVVPEQVVPQLRARGYALVDGFLGDAFTLALRHEAEQLYERGEMEISKSTRFCPENNSVVIYDKRNVFSTQMLGGDAYYSSPRLHEYVVGMVTAMYPWLAQAFPEASLSPQMASNKLAVCIGDGSSYDKHYDNSGEDDLRKLTVLLYLNPVWRPELGGEFRIFSCAKEGNGFTHTDIAPIADRLLVFWSDRCVHSVSVAAG